MKFLKSYKIFESSNLELEKQLNVYNIEDYIINEDGSIDANQEVHLYNKNLTEIPFKFNKVNDYFNIAHNQLTSLKNCPKYIDIWFVCSDNKLTSLEFGPEYVGHDYICHHNKLKTLKGCIEEVYGYFDCHNNKLTTLEFCPMEVEGSFNCSNNKLTELDKSPFIRSSLYCRGMFKTEPEFFGHCKNLIWI